MIEEGRSLWIRPLNFLDIPIIAKVFSKPSEERRQKEIFNDYLHQAAEQKRLTLAAQIDEEFVGYVSLILSKSTTKIDDLRIIPSIQDFDVTKKMEQSVRRSAEEKFGIKYLKSNNIISAKSYEKIAKHFDKYRNRKLIEKPWLDRAILNLPRNAKILDLGCGMGEPITKYLIEKGFDVTGLDVSESLIRLAQRRLGAGNFIIGDIRNFVLEEKFNLIIAWNSLHHLTPKEQRGAFGGIAQHLNKGGNVLFTSGIGEFEVWTKQGEEEIYRSSLSASGYKRILHHHRFALTEHREDDALSDLAIWIANY